MMGVGGRGEGRCEVVGVGEEVIRDSWLPGV